jgi:hypothetical protein
VCPLDHLRAHPLDPRRGSLPEIPRHLSDTIVRRFGPMLEYVGRRGEERYAVRSPTSPRYVNLGGMSPHDRDNSPSRSRFGSRPGRRGRRSRSPTHEGEYYDEGVWSGAVHPPRGVLRGPDGPGDFIPPPSTRVGSLDLVQMLRLVWEESAPMASG